MGKGRAPLTDADPTPRRDTYRHGDLRRALLEAGVALAREGGPSAVVLREATRRAGVVPNAAYRHFANRDDLFDAVRAAALGALARAMEDEMAQAQRSLTDAAERARAAFKAVGTGYVRFARHEPGLFRAAAAFGAVSPGEAAAPRAGQRGKHGRTPLAILRAALDALVESGVLAPARRPGAEFLAWSAVHGMALLALDGPLRGCTDRELSTLAQQLVAMVERGL